MARVTGTLTGTTQATTAPPVRPPLLTKQIGHRKGPPGTVFVDAIYTRTAVFNLVIVVTGLQTVSAAGTYQWLCPQAVTHVNVKCYGGGGGPGNGGGNGGGGGGGGAYAERGSVPVTPGTLYTFVVGSAGFNSGHTDATDSSFTGDSSTQVVAQGGKAGIITAGGVAGQAASSIGDSGLVHSGGTGGNGGSGLSQGGGGGGASGNAVATGAIGNNGAGSNVGGTGGTGANGGGSGGHGSLTPTAATSPGGGGGGSRSLGGDGTDGGGGLVVISYDLITPTFISSVTSVKALTLVGDIALPFIGSDTVVYALTIQGEIATPFIASTTTVYTLSLVANVAVPFISSATVVYTLTLSAAGLINVPFISSHTHVWTISSLFDPNKTYGGPGNGGEAFALRLNANGVTDTATLAVSLGVGISAMTLSGDSAFPVGKNQIVTIDSEQILVFNRGSGSYSIHGRGMGNTTAAAHTAGATVSWGDTYDQAIAAGSDIAHEFTADINSTGSFTYPGWLICFDSSQAYLSGDRYPFHVTEVEGVFDAGAGTGGTNRCDQAQPNAVSAPATTSDYCPAALSNPARISSDITAGDVAIVRYTNPEATVLDLGPRAVTLQSWFGLMRVSTTNTDVTFTDPNGIVVDTTGTYDTFTGSINGVFAEPLPLQIGIAPDASDAAGFAIPTPGTVPWETVTLPGTDRKFTFGSGGGGYNRAGWPICCLAVRQGNKRVPFWQSWDWRDYSYVYTGFGTDAVYAQLLINRNGIVFDSVPAVSLPGSQDIDGPDAVWDDAAYFFGCSWYVVLFNGPYIVHGPTIGGTGSGGSIGGSGGYAPGVTFPGGGGPPIITVPPFIEGGSGGGIEGNLSGLHVWGTSGKGFS